MPAVVTDIDVVEAPVLHSNVPVKLLAVKTELPQLLTVCKEGVDGMLFGFEFPFPAALMHPFEVLV